MTTEQTIEYLGADADAIHTNVLARIRKYVEVETPSAHPDAIRRLAEIVAADASAVGGAVTVHDAPGLGVNLHIRFGATHDSRRPIGMLAHMDTVQPLGTLAERPFQVNGDRATGPGVYDMKAGLALLMEAVAWHQQRGMLRRSVEMLVTCDEEIGSHSSRAMIADLAQRCRAMLVPEPCLPGGGVKTSRKGVATYRIETTGIAAHAGSEPGTTVSAIAELVHQLAHVMTLADHSRGTTVNIGTIAGGSATNVVAPHATAGIDIRLAQEGEFERVDAALQSLRPFDPRASVQLTLAESRPPLIRNGKVAEVYGIAREVAAGLGVDLKEGLSGGGSDGSLAAAAGGAVLDGLGPDGGGAHAVDEHILIADLPFRLALLCGLIERL